ncbi:MAG TPA: hypothetical protein VG125_13985 [Pirellulales bacterium]|jgi:hypothetical protein|nr:hypothetical protein [Pirellulales bacterium]
MAQGGSIADTVTSPRLLPRWLVLTPIVATPFIIVGVVYVVACWRAHANLAREIALIRARGEPLRFAELAASRDDAEAVARSKRVAALVDRLRGAPGDFLDEVATKGIQPVGAKQVEQIIAPYHADVQAIVDELRGGKCLFEYDYETREPYNILLPHVQYLRDAARVLAGDAHVALATGDEKRACQRLHDMFDLDEALRHEPFAVSQMARKADGGRSLDLLQFVLGHEAATVADMDILGERLDGLEENFRLASCMQVERMILLAEMENLGRPGTEEIFTSGTAPLSAAKATGLNHWWGSWLYRPCRLCEEAATLRTFTRWTDLVDRPGPAVTLQFNACSEEVGKDDFPIFDALVRQGIDASKLHEAGLLYRQRLLSARLALAVVRHRMVHAALPASLDELEVPPTERLGLLSGKPLVYQATTAEQTSGQTEGFAIHDESPDKSRFEVRFAVREEPPKP